MIKNGRIPEEEKKKIIELAEKLPYTDIAAQFGRNPLTIKKFLEENVGSKLLIGGVESNLAYDIKKSIVWKELKLQFSEDELDYFLYHWQRTVSQFKDDVFPTEQMQIVDMIKIDILMIRIMKEQKESIDAINSLQNEILTEQKKELEKDENKISVLSSQIAFNRAAKESLGKEYTNYQTRKENMLKDLKATRAERVRRIEDSKHTVIGWVTELLQNNKLRKDLGIRIEKFRIAVDLEKIRMFQPHEFLNKDIDCPLLTSETLEYLKEKEKKQEKNEEM